MNRSPGARRLANVTSLLMCGVLAGVVVAAAAFPLVGSVGLSAKAASESFEDLPSELKAGPPPLTSTLRAADNTYITSFYEENRVNIPLEQVAKTMQDAIVAAEDNRFWTHQGTDPKGVVRALVSNVFSGDSSGQGGSTLTQQYVKQALYYSATTEEERQAAVAPSAARKLQEVKYAVALEQKLSKREIMARYLNIANFGNNSYGVAAASQGYFSKPASKLSLAEAALLASIVKNPSKYDPIDGDKERAKERRDYVIDRMLALNLIPAEQADAAKQQPIALRPKKAPRKCENSLGDHGFYCGWFLDWWRANPQFGKTPEEREQNLFKGGYNIRTALDPRMQAAAQKAVDAQLPRTSKYANGIVLIQPGTGRVKAMAVNRSYGLKAPATTAPLLSGGSAAAGYQAGSTFKMFTLVAALEKGMPLSTTIHSPERYVSKYSADGECAPKWCPSNASDRMTGAHTMWSAFGESVNTYFVQLEEMVSVKAAVQSAEKLGVRLRAPRDLDQRAAAFKSDAAWGAFTLGVAQVTPLDMANAYATIAARGKYCAPLPLLKITDRDGKPLPYANPNCKQVISPQVADAAADAARCPVGDGAASACSHPGGGVTASRVSNGVPGPVAGKTGTTDGEKGTPTAWFVGFTPKIAGASFVANPAKANDTVEAIQRGPVTIFIATMKKAVPLFGDDPGEFERPTDAMAFGVRVTVPEVEGEPLEQAKQRLTEAGFTPIVDERQVRSDDPPGTVARTDPNGGDRANKGGIVTIFVSGGPDFDEGQDNGDPGNGRDNGRGNDGNGDSVPIFPGFPDLND